MEIYLNYCIDTAVEVMDFRSYFSLGEDYILGTVTMWLLVPTNPTVTGKINT